MKEKQIKLQSGRVRVKRRDKAEEGGWKEWWEEVIHTMRAWEE